MSIISETKGLDGMALDFLNSIFGNAQMPISTAIFTLIASVALTIIESAISRNGLPGWRNAVERDITICVSLTDLEQKLGNKASRAESVTIGRLYNDALKRISKSQQKKKALEAFLGSFFTLTIGIVVSLFILLYAIAVKHGYEVNGAIESLTWCVVIICTFCLAGDLINLFVIQRLLAILRNHKMTKRVRIASANAEKVLQEYRQTKQDVPAIQLERIDPQQLSFMNEEELITFYSERERFLYRAEAILDMLADSISQTKSALSGTVKIFAHFPDSPLGPPSGAVTLPAASRPGSGGSPIRSRRRT